MLLPRQAPKMGKTCHISGFISSHELVKWDHNIYDLLQKLFFIICDSADYWNGMKPRYSKPKRKDKP